VLAPRKACDCKLCHRGIACTNRRVYARDPLSARAHTVGRSVLETASAKSVNNSACVHVLGYVSNSQTDADRPSMYTRITKDARRSRAEHARYCLQYTVAHKALKIRVKPIYNGKSHPLVVARLWLTAKQTNRIYEPPVLLTGIAVHNLVLVCDNPNGNQTPSVSVVNSWSLRRPTIIAVSFGPEETVRQTRCNKSSTVQKQRAARCALS
jgi:hypothetical protein